jgi:hypothetical protein
MTMEGGTMLQQVLQTVSAGGVHSLHQLAQQLDISEELLVSMIDELVRMGYLKPLRASCAERCPHCPEANRCGIGSSSRAWALTTNGEKIAQR